MNNLYNYTPPRFSEINSRGNLPIAGGGARGFSPEIYSTMRNYKLYLFPPFKIGRKVAKSHYFKRVSKVSPNFRGFPEDNLKGTLRIMVGHPPL
jgi:hypothetical protein